MACLIPIVSPHRPGWWKGGVWGGMDAVKNFFQKYFVFLFALPENIAKFADNILLRE
jgi:hypothetical protein